MDILLGDAILVAAHRKGPGNVIRGQRLAVNDVVVPGERPRQLGARILNRLGLPLAVNAAVDLVLRVAKLGKHPSQAARLGVAIVRDGVLPEEVPRVAVHCAGLATIAFRRFDAAGDLVRAALCLAVFVL